MKNISASGPKPRDVFHFGPIFGPISVRIRPILFREIAGSIRHFSGSLSDLSYFDTNCCWESCISLSVETPSFPIVTWDRSGTGMGLKWDRIDAEMQPNWNRTGKHPLAWARSQRCFSFRSHVVTILLPLRSPAQGCVPFGSQLVSARI